MESDYTRSIWEKVSVEVEGPFEKTPSGNEYVVILTDVSSKWIEAKPLAEKSVTYVATFVTSTFARMGFCDCQFININQSFERDIRQAIHQQGLIFVKTLGKFRTVLDKIWNEELENSDELQDAAVADLHYVYDTSLRGHHTEKLLQWIAEHNTTWDNELEGFLFQLRTGVPENGDDSPFAMMHGGRQSTSNSNSISESPSLSHGRGFRGKRRGRGSWRRNCFPNSPKTEKPDGDGEMEQTNECSKVDSTNSSQSILKRLRGRPRKISNLVRCSESQIREDSPEALAVKDVKRNYGLRTTLKAKVKTNIVQRMLRLSTNKRIGSNEKVVHAYAKKPQSKSILKKGLKLKETTPKEVKSDEMQVVSFVEITPTLDDVSEVQEFVVEKFEDADALESAEALQHLIPENERSGNDQVTMRDSNPTVSKTVSFYLDEQNINVVEVAEGNETTDDIEHEVDNVENEDDDEEEDDDDEMDDDIEHDDDVADEDYEDEEAVKQEQEAVKLSCSECPGSLFTEKELQLHQTFHKDGSKFLYCPYCSHVTSTWEHIQEHLVLHIENKSAIAAAGILRKLGSRSAVSIASRKIRRKELAGSLPLRCQLCPTVRMATDVEVQVHALCHKEDSKLLHCPYCNTVCGNWHQMQEHLGSHDEVPYEAYSTPIEEKTCPKCSKVFSSSEMVIQHQMVFHARDRRYQCEMCGKTFKERKSILRHQELHANILYQCTECNYRTKIQKDFLEHQRIHQGMGFVCTLCKKAFARSSQLTLHMESHRKDRGVAICDQCGHQANGLTALRHHIRNVHGNPQSWPCTLCTYVGKTKSNLKGHTDRIHNKKFKCSHCDFACLAECTLLKHVDIFHNEGERKYPCPHCPYRAREPKCLTEHVRVLHNPFAQKFPCDFCGTEFKTKSMLRDHMPQHTGQRFVCQLCGYVAKYRSILYRHVKKRHPDEKLSSVMKTTDPLIVETPDGKPIMSSKGQTSRRRHQPVQVASTASLTDMIEIEDENAERYLITADMSELGIELDGETGSRMYIATTADGETVTVDQNSIVLDASLLAQAAAGGAITLPNNLCLQIIQKDQEGDSITMQVIPTHGNGGDNKAVELLLLASDMQHEDIGNIVMEESVIVSESEIE